ncbi:MAG TPA: VOC family protein [Gemmatimonadaceae bacterium]
MLQRIDHLVYAAPDLDAACAEIERRLGAAPSPGGQHIGRGTRNALVAIGPRSYLEIIAPDPDQPSPNGPRWFNIDSMETPRLVAWAAHATNLTQLVADATRRGVHLGSVASGSRKRADGVALTWDVTDPTTVLADGVIPFFIDWKTSPHPATSATVGPVLVELRARHPDPQRVRRLLEVLGVELPIEHGDRAELVANFRSEHGVAVFL